MFLKNMVTGNSLYMNCKIKGCMLKVKAKGYCYSHYSKKFSGKQLNEKQLKIEKDLKLFIKAFKILGKYIVQRR